MYSNLNEFFFLLLNFDVHLLKYYFLVVAL